MSQPQFFVDHKRGEVNELQAALRNPKIVKDDNKKREVIKKVIAYMTLGIDVSRIFSEMIMASNTKDLVQKKMVYHYLATYASQKADLAILVINTLQKDCRDDDPMTRGLALRSLCSLRLENAAEYVVLPIRKGLNDSSPYVRKCAVLGIAKLYRFEPDAVKGTDLVDLLYNMLKDRDTLVITSVMNALNEVLTNEGGMVFNKQIVMHLLNRIRDFAEWGQCTVLDLVAKYQPSDEGEMFDIMNLLEDRLKHANSAVVMGTTKVFLNFTKDHPAVYTEVFKRLKAPLLTLMGGGGVELAYVVLCHIKVLVEKQPEVFATDYKHFYLRFNDPLCLKLIKVEILSLVADEASHIDVLNEFAEYVADTDIEIARASIREVGRVAVKLEIAVDDVLEHLIAFLDLKIDYVSAEAVMALRDVLRKYPERHQEVIPTLSKSLSSVEETEGKSAVIWMIGEYGDTIESSPYILEPLIDAFDEEPSHQVRSELLSAAVKLFFKRPPEMQAMLGRLLKKAVNDVSKVEVRDRALLYYRLLRLDVHEAARIINCPKGTVESFIDPEEQDMRNSILLEFNSLCAIYGKPSAKFVRYVDLAEDKEEEEVVPEAGPQQLEELQYEEEEQQAPAEIDLFGGAGIPAAPAPALAPTAPSLILDAAPTIDAATFQHGWGSFPMGFESSLSLGSSPQQATIEQAMSSRRILTMASGGQGGQFKFYFYARAESSLFLVEMLVDSASGAASFKAKSNADQEQVQAFGRLLSSAFS